MIKVFITGLAGMLGSNIAYKLKDDYVLSGVDLLTVNMHGVDSYNLDALDYEKTLQCLKKIKPDVIIHTAAAVNVDKCETEPNNAKALNVEMTDNICKAADVIGAKVIYISTDAVFDGESQRLYNEEDKVSPINIYGKTKLEGENIVIKNKKNLILRTNIYGFNIQSKNSFGEWIYTSLMKDGELKMFTDIDFSPILVNDLSEIIDLSIKKDISGLYHACGTGYISKYDFGCKLKEIFKISTGKITESNSENFSFKAKRAKHMGMDNKNICAELSCKVRTPIESIKEFYRLYKKGYKEELMKFGGINE